MKIDPRLREGNEDDVPDWIDRKLPVILDVWIAEYLKDPEIADKELREKGFVLVADRLVELFGPEWWMRLAK